MSEKDRAKRREASAPSSSKKEKKRRLILSDSDEDDYSLPPAPAPALEKSAAPVGSSEAPGIPNPGDEGGLDKETGSLMKSGDEMIEDTEKRVVNPEEVNRGGEAGTDENGTKQEGNPDKEFGIDRKEVAEKMDGADNAGEELSIDGKEVTEKKDAVEELKTEVKMSTFPAGATMEESEAGKAKTVENIKQEDALGIDHNREESEAGKATTGENTKHEDELGIDHNKEESEAGKAKPGENTKHEDELGVDHNREVSEAGKSKTGENTKREYEVGIDRNMEETDMGAGADGERNFGTEISARPDAVTPMEEAVSDGKGATEKKEPEEEIDVGVNSAVKPVVYNKREDADIIKERTVERRIDKKSAERSDIYKRREDADSDEEITAQRRFDKKSAASSDFYKRREDTDSEDDRFAERRFGTKSAVRSDALYKRREDADSDDERDTERKYDARQKVFKKWDTSSDVANDRDEAGSRSPDRRNREEHKTSKWTFVKPDIDIGKYWEEAVSYQKAPEKRKRVMELKADKKRAMWRDAGKLRDGGSSDKKKGSYKEYFMDRLRREKEHKYDRMRARKPEDFKRRSEFGNDKKKPLELSRDKEIKIDKKRAQDVPKERKALRVVKEVAESGSDSKNNRKRVKEMPDATFSPKRIKTELKHGRDRTPEINGKKMKAGFLKHGKQRTEAKAEHVSGGKSSLASLDDDTVSLSAEKSKSVERSGQRILQKLKDDSAEVIEIKESGTSQHKDAIVQGKDDGPALLQSNKKVSGLEKVHVLKEEEDGVKHVMSSTPSASGNHTTPKHPSLSGGKIVLAKPSSPPLAEKPKFRETKTEQEASSPVSKKAKLSRRKHDREVKREEKATSPVLENDGISSRKHGREAKRELKVSSPVLNDEGLPGRKHKKDKTASEVRKQKRAGGTEKIAKTFKQKIREEIKEVLLSAGWKIDLRPRRGRSYEDQVFIPPTGGGGYWSITKAYEVFQKQSGRAPDDKISKLSKKSSKKSIGNDNNIDESACPRSAIPEEFLSMLKRNTAKKREKEFKEAQRKERKKVKETIKIPGVRGRKKLNIHVDSNTKDLSGKLSTKPRGCALLVRGANQDANTEDDNHVPYIWKRTVLSWMIDCGVVPINAKVRYMVNKKKHSAVEGWITRDGIHCSCCSKILTVSKFEIHADSKLHQPYENIFLEESGVSLLQCQLDAWEKQSKSERHGFYNLQFEGDDPNDDTCGICGDGGDLICCDGCPSTFHQSCLGIETLPSGDWHCSYCSCRYCRIASEESAHPVSPLLSCYLCEMKYHQVCIPEEDAVSTSSNSSFCGRGCKRIFKRLQKHIGLKNDLEGGFSLRIIRRVEDDCSSSRLGLPQRAECNAKVAIAFAVMDECFLPITDQRSGINLIHNVVYNCGSNFNRLSYSGFYTFVLERGDEIISAASVRIHGTRLAEMPFIGTRNIYRRQGMCRMLLNGIETALCSLGIQKLIIPAISELTHTWTDVFGFKPLKKSQKREIKSINMLVFPGIGLLQKSLLKKISSGVSVTADKNEPGIKHHPHPNTATEDANSVHPEAIHLEEVIGGEKFEMGSSTAPKTEVHCKDVMHDNQDLMIVDAGTTHHTSEAKCSSPDVTASVLQDARAKTSPGLPCVVGTLDQVTTNSHVTPARFKTYAVDQGTADSSHEAKDEVSSVKSKCNENDGDSKCDAAENVSVFCRVPHGNENNSSNESTVAHDVNSTTINASGHERPVSDTKKPAEQDTQLAQEPLKSQYMHLPIASDELLHHANDSFVPVSLSSLPEADESCKKDMIKTLCETTDGSVSIEQSSGTLHADSSRSQVPDSVCDQGVVGKPILFASGVVSCDTSDVSPCADATDNLASAAGNTNLEMVANDSTLVNDFDLRASSASDHCGIPNSINHHSADGAGCLDDGLCENIPVPVETLKPVESTLAAVGSKFIKTNMAVDEGTFESDQVLEGESGSDILKDVSAVSISPDSLAIKSSPCASKVATIAVDNTSEPIKTVPDVGI